MSAHDTGHRAFVGDGERVVVKSVNEVVQCRDVEDLDVVAIARWLVLGREELNRACDVATVASDETEEITGLDVCSSRKGSAMVALGE